MPAEQALTEARRRVGPSYGGGGGADAFRARLEEWAAFFAPVALILGLALAGGGFDLSERHVAGLAVWLVVVVLLALGAASRAVLARPFYWTSGLIGAVALFSAISSLWSGSIELSVTEVDRVLVYLGVFLAAFLIAQTDQRRQRFAEGVAIGLIGIALMGLASRLLPDLVSVADGLGSGARTSYPLDYWNANGVAAAIGAMLILWLSRRSLTVALRWCAVAVLPAVLLALYLTYSRGGLLALVVACAALAILSHDRLWLLGTLAIGAIGAMPAVLAVQDRRDLADNLPTQAAVDQGLTVLLILLAGTALTLLLFAGMRRLERRQGGLAQRAVALSRDGRVLRWIAVVAALLAIGAAVAVGGRAWDQFTNSDLQLTKPEERFNTFSGTGRDEFWRVAIDAFGEDPIAGHGAGTYQFSWDQLREIPVPVLDAHSLYLEAFAELGLIGGLLMLAMVGTLLWTGFAAWRAASGVQREFYAALLAAAIAFAVAAAIDWFWEITGLGVVFFLVTAALVAGRCAQLARAQASANGQGAQRRFGLAVAGLALAWITALALVGPLLVDRELDSSRAAAADGDYVAAVDHANTARSIEPWAASPYLELGLLAQAQGDFATARERITEAIDREENNWVLYYVRARLENEAGETAAAQADIDRALQLNPEEKCLTEGFEGC
ncbi:MAG: O-antigen ligase family protein [Solirubrobacterales bacterium]